MKNATTTKPRICFVTGTRAEFGLMRTVLHAIQQHPKLRLQIVATGMHLDNMHGDGLAAIRADGFNIDAVVAWPPESRNTPAINAANTGHAIAKLAQTFDQLNTDVVLVVGDRVEAFAAAAAAHLSHRVVAHIHGGDRALGQIDDSLRHAITKLAHLHFPATLQSAQRIQRLGEDPRTIHRVGSPGNDDILRSAAKWPQLHRSFAALHRRRYALLVLHPVQPNPANERRHAQTVLHALRQSPLHRIVIVYPNNDPGSAGIIACWKKLATDQRLILCQDLPRPTFLGLLRFAAVLVGNSSSGIIEAASFNTPVLDIGPRQAGRERGANVLHCHYSSPAIARHLRLILRPTATPLPPTKNIYGGNGAGRRIADILARLKITPQLTTKLIRY
ncbi:MAG: UDP-N-acetylglucosamine 2-epimerase [Planctomycetota bacterium]|nr:UDP-N-acetylglucosamine 2-epimerase [Planctomycetota bacterium]